MGAIPKNAGNLAGGFGRWLMPPPAPDLPKLPGAAPDATDQAVQAARASDILRQQSARGRRSTFLTGPLGEAGATPTVGTKTLLGG